ncbi:uncharacterized protein [Pyxicephalus adspersus]|uniref:uncharacterized protein n=1 Tax=Pyxicephalus adspersus TaxID=30357 RepID=UPI003B5CDEED
MKIAVGFLLVAIGCCFNPAASTCVKSCSSACQQNQLNDVACLENALIKDFPGTINAMTNVLCAYDKFKISKSKAPILGTIQDLQVVAGCSLHNLVGTAITLEDLSADVNGALLILLRAIHDILLQFKIGDYSIPLCGPLKPLLTKTSKVLYLYGVPSFIGPMQPVGINEVSRLLSLVHMQSPELFQKVIEVIVGPSILVRELAMTVGRLTGTVMKTVGDMGKTVNRATDILTGTAGGLLQPRREATGVNRRSNGLLGVVTDIVQPVLDSVGNVVHTVGNTLGAATGAIQGVTRVLDGPSGVLQTATGLIGSNGGPLGGIFGGGGSESKADNLGSATKETPNLLGGILRPATQVVPGLLGGSLGVAGSPSDPNLSGGSGRDGLASLLASGTVSGKLGDNIGLSAGGNLGLSLGSLISNTGMPGEDTMENGGVINARGSIPIADVSRARDTTAIGRFGLRK